MAYFSNGMEGDWYRERYCNRCVHDISEDCPVYLVHLLYNYNQCDTDDRGKAIKTILGSLWPRSDDDGNNGDCKMFILRADAVHNLSNQHE